LESELALGSGNFWKMADGGRIQQRAVVAQHLNWENIVCPIDEGHQRGGYRSSGLIVDVEQINADAIWTWESNCIVSDRVRSLLEQNQLTGLEFRPAIVRTKSDPDGMRARRWELRAIGWGGIAPASSGIHLTGSCAACGYLRYSCFDRPELIIQPEQWDGSDFFFVWPLPKYIFVSERARQVLSTAEVTGLAFVPPIELRCQSGGLGPGRLHYWLPEQRAHELGDSLGIY
jgi:hypothetical protein